MRSTELHQICWDFFILLWIISLNSGRCHCTCDTLKGAFILTICCHILLFTLMNREVASGIWKDIFVRSNATTANTVRHKQQTFDRRTKSVFATPEENGDWTFTDSEMKMLWQIWWSSGLIPRTAASLQTIWVDKHGISVLEFICLKSGMSYAIGSCLIGDGTINDYE